MNEQTLAIIKPDAVKRNLIGRILAMMEAAELRVVAMKMLQLTVKQAEGFYAVHHGKPFFEPLVAFMTSGPVVCLVLEGDDAITRYRTLMGATNFENAEEGTIRRTFALSFQQNSVHGSDSPESAAVEIEYFFNALERVNS